MSVGCRGTAWSEPPGTVGIEMTGSTEGARRIPTTWAAGRSAPGATIDRAAGASRMARLRTTGLP